MREQGELFFTREICVKTVDLCIELIVMHNEVLGKFESIPEDREALGLTLINCYASVVISKLLVCMHLNLRMYTYWLA